MSDVSGACGCGCGGLAKAGNRFIKGHNQRGKSHDASWLANQSAGMKKAWLSPDTFKTNRSQPPELIARRSAKQKAIMAARSEQQRTEQNAKISAALSGRKLSEERRHEAVKTLLRYPDLSEDAKRRRNETISKSLIGTHGFGRGAKDRLDHWKALHWVVRDSRGVIHEFDNLQAWCRKNEHRFLPDTFQNAKLPLWKRAVGGFNDMQRTDKKGTHQWKGWTLVSVKERETIGAPDLLDRHGQSL